MPGFKDLTGHKFGRLTVLHLGERIVDSVHWVCKCDCGKERNVRAGYLRDGDVKSCGCWSREQSQINVKQAHISRTKHKTGSITKAKEVFAKRYSEVDDTITFEDFLEITKLNCYYCDAPPSNMKKRTYKKNG